MFMRRIGIVVVSAILVVVAIVALLLIIQGRQLKAGETDLRYFLQHRLPIHATIAQTHTLLQSREQA